MARTKRNTYSTVICKTVAGAKTGSEVTVHSGSNDLSAGWKYIYPVFHGMAFALYDGEATVEVRVMNGEHIIEVFSVTRFRFGGGTFQQITPVQKAS